MKLTNAIRDSFIRAVMQDVPQIDFTEQIRKATVDAVLETLPKQIKAIWLKPDTQPWVKTTTVRYAGPSSVTVPSPDSWNTASEISDKAKAELKSLDGAWRAQKKNREELEKRLHSCAYSVSTRKQLVELLPEFEKYLPPDQGAAVRSLPVVQNVVADFVKAGWPKDKK